MTRHWLSAGIVLCACVAVLLFWDTDASDSFAVSAQAQSQAQLTNAAPSQQTNAVTAGCSRSWRDYFAAVAKTRQTRQSWAERSDGLGHQRLERAFLMAHFSRPRHWGATARLALAAAERAFQLTEGKEPTVLEHLRTRCGKTIAAPRRSRTSAKRFQLLHGGGETHRHGSQPQSLRAPLARSAALG